MLCLCFVLCWQWDLYAAIFVTISRGTSWFPVYSRGLSRCLRGVYYAILNIVEYRRMQLPGRRPDVV